MATTAEKIDALEKVLNEGAAEVVIDGQKVKYDLPAIERRLAKLRRTADPTKRPRAATVNMSKFP